MLNIEVLGLGCPTCYRLAELCREVVLEKGVEATVESITDEKKISAYGVLQTPTLIINGKIMLSGKLPTKAILEKWFSQENSA
ncbi:redox-active disulfide protein 2 [Chloroherpeton thalassium ATCC 35110]|uniref:Redox-active disulfide protein 2 n=1 Tax=Chloroherpeton thalassium (strain ATCC 35110 / GB-78) TaxID=517418 RepID=B3QYW1_CHLT3|nr:thioredoxin family protein [Chloroherpeton thalassium]ACF13654.1 redox-active disulfide protein 2 [Chloroherpeton thalassium ATCC 35110]